VNPGTKNREDSVLVAGTLSFSRKLVHFKGAVRVGPSRWFGTFKGLGGALRYGELQRGDASQHRGGGQLESRKNRDDLEVGLTGKPLMRADVSTEKGSLLVRKIESDYFKEC